ncbi:virulence factor Mce family protein [Mycolicibacterium aichiense]|uniref:virulence factor Mce family protein n=1 Tax=Mycolicibacterium aichiense TaxID=1799 RepID=UPI003D67BD78
MRSTRTWVMAVAVLGLAILAGIGVTQWSPQHVGRTMMTAYFDNTNGLFVGDNVLVLGVKVGTIDAIDPQPSGARVSFWVDKKYKIPAGARAVILSPKLITSRAIQLTPAYTGGPALADGAVIPKERTAVPVEFDDFRRQLQKLTDSLQPTQPGGVSPMGQFINTTADNLRGQGAHIRDTIIKLSQAVSALGDHSTDIFATVKNLSTLVAALHDSADLMRQLNNNLASVTDLLANDPDEIARAVDDFDAAIKDVRGFVADNREALGTTTDKLGSVTKALVDSLDDVKQTLHVLPNVVQNVTNIYEPAHGAITGILSVNNFANPISFLCGAIQAASRMNGEESAKLCVQYLAPIVKNRQYNNLPFGMNPLVNAQARPNEVTYSEDWMRPDYRPDPPPAPPAAPENPPMAAEAPTSTDPGAGLTGMMLPAGG